MQSREFYKKNGRTYKNEATLSMSIHKNSTDSMANLRNSIVKKLLNRVRKTEKDYIYCSISGKPVTLFSDYPVVDGVLVYIKNKPKSKLKKGIDYEVVSVRRQKYYIFAISLKSLEMIMCKTVRNIEERVIVGRLYSKRAFCKIIKKNKNIKLGEFILHSKSLYHNGTRISNFISKYYKLKSSVDEWEEEKIEEPKKSWWQWW